MSLRYANPDRTRSRLQGQTQYQLDVSIPSLVQWRIAKLVRFRRNQRCIWRADGVLKLFSLNSERRLIDSCFGARNVRWAVAFNKLKIGAQNCRPKPLTYAFPF